jgi:gas vesicle protein
MPERDDRIDSDGGSGASFVMGLLTGTVLGAGLGMLFAPKAGQDLRNQVAEQAGSLANTASDGYRRAADTASELAGRGREVAGNLAGRGREVYEKTREAVSRGADEANRYVRDTAADVSAAASTASGTGSSRSGFGSTS